MRIIYSPCSYQQALVKAELPLLKDRRQELTSKFFKEILEKNDRRLHELLPKLNNNSVNIRRKLKFHIKYNTNRFRDSFILSNALKL